MQTDTQTHNDSSVTCHLIHSKPSMYQVEPHQVEESNTQFHVTTSPQAFAECLVENFILVNTHPEVLLCQIRQGHVINLVSSEQGQEMSEAHARQPAVGGKCHSMWFEQ